MAKGDAARVGQFIAPDQPQIVQELGDRLVRVPNPTEALLKLDLPDDLATALKAPLDAAGFRFEADTVSDPGGRCRSITVLTDGGVRLFIAFIPRWVLDDPSNVDNVGYLGAAFVEGSRVYILSDGDIKPTFAMVFQSWTRLKVETKVVNWSWFQGFADMSPTDQRNAIELSFDVKLTPASRSARATISIDDLSQAERELIQELLASRGANAGIGEKEYFKGFVNKMGLPEDWREEIADVWVGDAGNDAGKLVNWAFEKGWFPQAHEKREFSVIGVVLWQLAGDEVGAQGDEVVRITLKHELIADSKVLSALRDRVKDSSD
jgi:hypothetical protein